MQSAPGQGVQLGQVSVLAVVLIQLQEPPLSVVEWVPRSAVVRSARSLCSALLSCQSRYSFQRHHKLHIVAVFHKSVIGRLALGRVGKILAELGLALHFIPLLDKGVVESLDFILCHIVQLL